MIRLMLDRLPLYISGNLLSGVDDSANMLADRNPANPYTWTTAAISLYAEIDTNEDALEPLRPWQFPVNCLCLFGISESLLGATVDVYRYYPVTGYLGSAEYSTIIDSDRLWLPFDDTSYDGEDSTYDNIGLFKIVITQDATGTYSLGEVCIGLLETIELNYDYGRQYTQECPINIITSLGGIEWRSQQNSKVRNSLILEWGGSASDQDIALLRRIYEETEAGLYPLILIPEDTVRSGPRSCFYGYLPENFVAAQQFFNRNQYSLEFREALAYEEPAEVGGVAVAAAAAPPPT